MADSLSFDFGVSPVNPHTVGPTVLPPISGKTPASRAASRTGALHAAETRSPNIWTLRQVWREPLTINEVAAITGLAVGSVCSLKALLDPELEEVDHERIVWGDGRRDTWRTRWRIKSASSDRKA
jgi:hypothetical protein